MVPLTLWTLSLFNVARAIGLVFSALEDLEYSRVDQTIRLTMSGIRIVCRSSSIMSAICNTKLEDLESIVVLSNPGLNESNAKVGRRLAIFFPFRTAAGLVPDAGSSHCIQTPWAKG